MHYHDNILNFESIEHVLYLLGSLLYLIGTVMYWPPEIDRYHMTWLAKHLSLGVYFNLFSTQFEGGWAKHTMAGSIKRVIKDGMGRKFDMNMLGKCALSLTDVYNADFKTLGEVDSEGMSDFRCLVPIFLLDTVFFPEVFVLQREIFLQASHVFFLEIKAFDPLGVIVQRYIPTYFE